MTADAPSGPPTIGYLGPPGTFTEQALHTQSDLVELVQQPMASIPAVLRAAAASEIDFGFAAIENMIEGSVNATLDALLFDEGLLIQREVVIGIQLNLVGVPGASPAGVKRLLSYPHAMGQVRGYVDRELPGAVTEATNSTADAARIVAELEDPSVAAIAPARAAEVYGLSVLEEDVEDHPENQTRFVVVAASGVPAPTGHDKTSVVIFQRSDQPGSLLAILQEFAARAINLTKLESRPTKQTLGDYCFLIDLEGHLADEVVADCLRDLHMKQGRVKFLGSYPAAGDHGDSVRRDAHLAWRDADAWLTALRQQIR